MPTGEGEEVPAEGPEPDDPAALDTIGVALGLALMAAVGLVIGIVTVAVLWRLYPPTRGNTLPIAAVAGGSVVLTTVLWRVLGRRLGRRAGDWFVVGYGLAWLLLMLAVMGGDAVVFLREHAAQSLGLPT